MGSTYEPTKHNIVILLILIIKICNEIWITWSNKLRQKKCIKIRSTWSFNCTITIHFIIDYFKSSFIFGSKIYTFTKFPNCSKKKNNECCFETTIIVTKSKVFGLHPINIYMHYEKSWFFKRLKLIKMSTLTKRMFILIKGMGHERHMIVLVGSFDWSDHFDQVLSCTCSQEGQFFKMVHQDAHCLIKSAILNGHV
jgi:hypothetical protein